MGLSTKLATHHFSRSLSSLGEQDDSRLVHTTPTSPSVHLFLIRGGPRSSSPPATEARSASSRDRIRHGGRRNSWAGATDGSLFCPAANPRSDRGSAGRRYVTRRTLVEGRDWVLCVSSIVRFFGVWFTVKMVWNSHVIKALISRNHCW